MPRDFAAIRIEYGCNGGCDVTAALAEEVFDEDGDEKPAKGWAFYRGSKLSQKLASIEAEKLTKKIKELAKGDNKDASDKLLEALKTQGAAQVKSFMEDNWQTIFPKKEEKPATARVVLTRERCVPREETTAKALKTLKEVERGNANKKELMSVLFDSFTVQAARPNTADGLQRCAQHTRNKPRAQGHATTLLQKMTEADSNSG
eukprot:g2512.t1